MSGSVEIAVADMFCGQQKYSLAHQWIDSRQLSSQLHCVCIYFYTDVVLCVSSFHCFWYSDHVEFTATLVRDPSLTLTWRSRPILPLATFLKPVQVLVIDPLLLLLHSYGKVYHFICTILN